MLAVITEHAKNDGLIEGVIPLLVDGGLSILRCADDRIIFTEHDLAKTQNLKLILSSFEQLFGLKINFHKSELFCFGEAQDVVNAYTDLFGCGQGELMSQRTHWETPRGRYDEHSSKFSLSIKPKFNQPVGKGITFEGCC
jgi:hypothetical protein